MIAMKSIILYDFEVQNLYKNGKGQIRRVCKVQPPNDSYKLGRETSRKHDGKLFWYNPDGFFAEAQHFTCPFGAVGKEIWVKETWRLTGVLSSPYAYRASEEALNLIGETGRLLRLQYRWKSPVTMTREASRMMIVPERIWTEQVQDISAMDCVSEGTPRSKMINLENRVDEERMWFKNLYDSRAKPGYKWVDNPMVFAAEVMVK
jgi:hypothetical protein